MKNVLFSLFLISCISGFSQCYISVQAGGFQSMGQQIDGTLWSWGNNVSGQLGIGNLEAQTSPVQINEDTDWVTYSLGVNHVMAIKENGTLWLWGSNANDQLGDGTGQNSLVPIQIGADTDWMEVSAGRSFSLALKQDGTLWAWGANFFNQLGDGTSVNRDEPVMIGQDTDWMQIEAGAEHSIALKMDGTLWSWGSNNLGQLGNGEFENVSAPMQIGNANDWSEIQTGTFHTLALKADGTLWSWGEDDLGQLGRPTPALIDQALPGQIGTDNDWSAVGCGANFSLAIKENGTLWSCGENVSGALGDGTTDNRNEFEQVPGDEVWETADGGVRHTAALEENNAFLWGGNLGGQIGDGTNEDRLTPLLLNECTLSTDDGESQKFAVYPNPTVDILNISSDDYLDSFELAIHDLSGQLVMLSRTDRNHQLDLASLEAGVYLLVIKTKNGFTSHHRVVKN